MKRLYLSGPITGIADFKDRFSIAQSKLDSAGYTVVNPCEVGTIGQLGEISSWARNMRGDIEAMMRCDGVAYLDGWQYSIGARTEIEIATLVEIPAMSVYRWVELV